MNIQILNNKLFLGKSFSNKAPVNFSERPVIWSLSWRHNQKKHMGEEVIITILLLFQWKMIFSKIIQLILFYNITEMSFFESHSGSSKNWVSYFTSKKKLNMWLQMIFLSADNCLWQICGCSTEKSLYPDDFLKSSKRIKAYLKLTYYSVFLIVRESKILQIRMFIIAFLGFGLALFLTFC